MLAYIYPELFLIFLNVKYGYFSHNLTLPLTLYQKDSKHIERIQKVACKIILGYRYLSYEHSCLFFDTTSLANRRERLCKSFAIKNLKSENSFFSLVNKNVNTRSKSRIVDE